MTTTDATLRVPGHPHVFAIGDTAAALATAPDAPQGGFAPTAQVRAALVFGALLRSGPRLCKSF